jgi:hypothetical protein
VVLQRGLMEVVLQNLQRLRPRNDSPVHHALARLSPSRLRQFSKAGAILSSEKSVCNRQGVHLDTAAVGFQPSAALGRHAPRGTIAQLRVVAEQAGLRL